jgi:hypothetical protein
MARSVISSVYGADQVAESSYSPFYTLQSAVGWFSSICYCTWTGRKFLSRIDKTSKLMLVKLKLFENPVIDSIIKGSAQKGRDQ